MQKHVLFIPAGRTDLKILLKLNGEYKTFAVSSSCTRAFHQWLHDNPDKYQLYHEYNDINLYAYNRQEIKVVIEENELLIENKDKDETTLTDDLIIKDNHEKIVIVPVKLGRLVKALQEKEKNQDIHIVAAVVFNTWREYPADNKSIPAYLAEEPFANGILLTRWLASCFKHLEANNPEKPALGQAVSVNILQGEDKQDYQGDANPDAVNRVIKSITSFSGNPELHATLCGIGGIPNFKSIIRNSTFFYFNERSALAEDHINRDETTQSEDFIKPIGHLNITAEQSFFMRANIEKLILSGDFLGAEAVTRHIKDNRHEAWTLPIRLVAQLLRGEKLEDKWLKKLAESPLKKAIRLLNESSTRCLLPAIRAEAALQGERFVEAIGQTATFSDAALWDGIINHLKTNGTCSINELERSVQFHNKPAPPALLTPNSNGKACLEDSGQKRYKYKIDTMYPAKDDWLAAINSDNLSQYHEKYNTVRKYRNLNTHGKLDPKDLQKAIDSFYQAKCWTRKKNNADFNLRFIEQVDELCKDLGEISPKKLYKAFTLELIDCLRSYQFKKSVKNAS